MAIISISLPDVLLREVDGLIQKRGYAGRSEVVRAALMEFAKQQGREDQLTGHVNTIIVLGYPEKAERAVTEVRHSHNDLVTSMLHAHTAKDRCTTVLFGEGTSDQMRKFLAELRGLRDLESMDVTVLQ